MRRLTNNGWCWSPRCDECIICTGRYLLEAQLNDVRDWDTGGCGQWTLQPIPMLQNSENACLWDGQLSFSSGRIEFGLGPEFPAGPGVLLEGSVWEEATSGPNKGEEVLIGDWRSVGLSPLDCDFWHEALGEFVPSGYVMEEGWQNCDWAESFFEISITACVDEMVDA